MAENRMKSAEDKYIRLLLPVFQALWVFICAEDRHYRVAWGQSGWVFPDLLTLSMALLVLFKPKDTRFFFLLCLASVIGTFLAWPELANDSILILAVNLLILAQFLRNEREYLPMLRKSAWVILGLVYFLAGFHKLNSGYFDPENSCVRSFLELPQLKFFFPGFRLPATLVVTGAIFTCALELALPILFFIPRSRGFALLAGLLLHLCISFQIDTFTHAVFCLYLFYVPPGVLRSFFRWLQSRQGAPIESTFRFVLACILLLLFISGRSGRTHYPGFFAFCAVSAIGTGYLAIWVARRFRRSGISFPRLERPQNPWILGIVTGGLFLNSLGPYLGFRTTLAFAMFSNLRVERESNHFLIPARRLQVADEGSDLVMILWSELPQLPNHRSGSWLIPRIELARIFKAATANGMGRRRVLVRYEGRTEFLKAEKPGSLFEGYSPIKEKFFSFHAVPPPGVNRCLW